MYGRLMHNVWHMIMSEKDWQQRTYDEVFEDVCEFVERQRRMNPDFSIEFVKERLESKYIQQDQNWIGKGLVAEIIDAATIAAYEHILAEWRKGQKEIKEK